METPGFELNEKNSLNTLSDDIIKSPSIKNENLTPGEVHFFIAKKRGMNIAGIIPTNSKVNGMVEMMLDATQHHTLPLKKAPKWLNTQMTRHFVIF